MLTWFCTHTQSNSRLRQNACFDTIRPEMLNNQQPAKLYPCRQQGGKSEAELFIVEGDSAALAVASQRDSDFQAVLPMQGKPLNPMRAIQANIESNSLYADVIKTIGAGLGDGFASYQRHYQRIIILMDPDADGIHCAALLTLFFAQWMSDLFATKALYLIRPPVGQCVNTKTGTVTHAFTAAQFNAMLAKAKKEPGFETMKFRGLAGIPPQVLQACCIDPVSRRQLILTEQDVNMAKAAFG